MNVERSSPLPGLNKKCGDCTNQLQNGPFESGYPCKAAWAPLGYPLQPKREIDSNGSFTCDSFRPNLLIRIRNLANKVSLFAANSGIQLPQ